MRLHFPQCTQCLFFFCGADFPVCAEDRLESPPHLAPARCLSRCFMAAKRNKRLGGPFGCLPCAFLRQYSPAAPAALNLFQCLERGSLLKRAAGSIKTSNPSAPQHQNNRTDTGSAGSASISCRHRSTRLCSVNGYIFCRAEGVGHCGLVADGNDDSGCIWKGEGWG